jgi:hypothetical protein
MKNQNESSTSSSLNPLICIALLQRLSFLYYLIINSKPFIIPPDALINQIMYIYMISLATLDSKYFPIDIHQLQCTEQSCNQWQG